MTIEVSVKTLDGQNRSFSVDEEMTVRAFKDKIAESINIAADQQRLIFRGRVLQDTTKLSQHDVGGKVIHVVQRLPGSTLDDGPNTTGRTTTSTSSTGPHHHHDFVMGSFSVPSDSVSPDGLQNIVQQALGNFGDLGRNARVTTRTHTTSDGNQMDVHINLGSVEIGPARTESQSQNRINNARRMIEAARRKLNTLQNPTAAEAESTTPEESPATSTSPDSQSARAPSGGDSQANSSSDTQTPNGNSQPQQPRATALADILQEVLDLNRDFQPYLEQYEQLLRGDPPLTDESERTEAEQLCSQVSRILHNISHAYHSVSDVMIDMSQPPPRELRAPPAPAPHPTAVIQQTIPVRANIAIATPRGTPSGSPQLGRRQMVPQSAPAPTPPTTTPVSTSTPSSTTASTTSPSSGPNPLVFVEVGPSSVSIASMRTMTGNSTVDSRPSAPGGQMMPPPGAPPSGVTSDYIQNIVQGIASSVQRAAAAGFSPISSPNVAPTATPQPTPTPVPTATVTRTPSTDRTSTATSTVTPPSGGGSNQPPVGGPIPMMFPGIPGLPAGIPGLTPPPPAVDPYLPCQSRHWLTQRATAAANGTPTSQINATNQTPSTIISGMMEQIIGQRVGSTSTNNTSVGATPSGFSFLPPGSFGPMPTMSVRTHAPGTVSTATSTQTTSTITGPGGNQPDVQTQMTDQVFAQMIQSIGSTVQQTMTSGSGPTLGQFLNQFRDQTPGGAEMFVQGDGFINELITMISSHLTFPDVLALFVGQSDCIGRMRRPLQQFIRNNILRDAMPTNTNINDAVDRLVGEITTEMFDENFTETTRNNIDFPASIGNAIRHFLRTNINYILNNTDSDAVFSSTVYSAVRTLFGEIVVLTRYCLDSGLDGFFGLIRNRMTALSNQASSGVQSWMTETTVTQIREMVPNITVTDQDVQQYIVFKSTKPQADGPAKRPRSHSAGNGSMDGLDEDDSDHGSFHSADSDVRTDPSVPETMDTSSEDDWRQEVPPEWIPVMSQDVEKMRSQAPQRPFSDAYLMGSAPKRRKLMSDKKPQNMEEASSVVTDTLRAAISSSSAQPITSLDDLGNDVTSDHSLQAAFQQHVQQGIQERLTNDPDFTPSRFEKSDEYFKSSKK